MSRGRSRTFPTPFTITHVTRTKTGENTLGQPIYDETSMDRQVVTWYPTDEAERNNAALAGRTISEMTMLTLDGGWNAADRVVLDGDDYEVIGRAEDYTHNPFTSGFGGYAIKLRRVHDG